MARIEIDAIDAIDAFADLGIRALVTTRAAGDFALAGAAPIGAVLDRWGALRAELGRGRAAPRLATATQVHGAQVIEHTGGWDGWLRGDAADGHFSRSRGTIVAVTVADCTPVFIGHPSGAIALLHAGWRGTAAGIVSRAVSVFARYGFPASELRLYLGPAICGGCYTVGAEVYRAVTGQPAREANRSIPLDLRQVLADQARAAGVRDIGLSAACTRCDSARFYSHRGGDGGRQVAAMVALASESVPALPKLP